MRLFHLGLGGGCWFKDTKIPLSLWFHLGASSIYVSGQRQLPRPTSLHSYNSQTQQSSILVRERERTIAWLDPNASTLITLASKLNLSFNCSPITTSASSSSSFYVPALMWFKLNQNQSGINSSVAAMETAAM